MHKFLLVFILLFHLAVQAQSQTKSPAKQASPPPAYIGKTWKIFSIEEFGVTKLPAKKTVNDMLQLNADNTFMLRIDSMDVSGKYTRAGKSLVLSTEKKEAYYLTILKELPDTLNIQCKNPDLITSVFKYIKQ